MRGDEVANAVDAVVVGSGPNGLAAAITLAQAGLSVRVLERRDTPGGGLRSSHLTLPGFVHDVCAAVHPLALASPFFRRQGLDRPHGEVEWVDPPVPLAHPLDDGTAAALFRDVHATADALGDDGAAYLSLMRPVAARFAALTEDVLGPLHWPAHPLPLLRFGLRALRSAAGIAHQHFTTPAARALWAGLAAHAILPLERSMTSAVALVLGAAAHAVGWPFARGGSQRIADALVARLRGLGGQIVTGVGVDSLADLPPHRVALFDVVPRELLRIAEPVLPPQYQQRLAQFRHGPGVFKLDLALEGAIPWRAPVCRIAGTVHVGGSYEEIAANERAVWRGEHPQQPFVLVAQPSLFDDTRAPQGFHTVWAYCHVPHGSAVDMTMRVEAQIERFAPGFRSRIIARHPRSAAGLERYNPNFVGGDISGGVADLAQTFARPILRRDPYATPVPGLYLCSASTPPGPGTHGLCGQFAAASAWRELSSAAGAQHLPSLTTSDAPPHPARPDVSRGP